MNACQFIGRLTAEPELQHTPDGTAVLNFTLAVDRENAKDKTDFIHFVTWRKTAEFVDGYFHKGDRMGVRGSLQSRAYLDKGTGKSRTVYEVTAERVYFADGKRPAYQGGSATAGAVGSGEFQEIDDGDDLPF